MPFSFKDDFDLHAPTSGSSSPPSLLDHLSTPASGRSIVRAMYNNVLSPDNPTGKGLMLQGEHVVCIHMPMHVHKNEFNNELELAIEFEVVKWLGAGSYAVIYQVKEVLSWHEYSNNGCISWWIDGLDGEQMVESREYRRQYVVKCLSKVNLNEEVLKAQMTEVHGFFPVAALCLGCE
jgi:hypothetical protein